MGRWVGPAPVLKHPVGSLRELCVSHCKLEVGALGDGVDGPLRGSSLLLCPPNVVIVSVHPRLPRPSSQNGQPPSRSAGDAARAWVLRRDPVMLSHEPMCFRSRLIV